MNREILFRGKRVDNGEWVYGNLVGQKHICTHLGRIPDSLCNPIRYFPLGTITLCEIIPSTVGQFTGLTDKNGTKIFEGDRLRHLRKYNTGHISVCSVVFRNGGFHLYYGNFIYETCELINRNDYSFEVIGNIHERKETKQSTIKCNHP